MKEAFAKIIERLEEHNRKLKTMKNQCIALSDREVSDVENHAYNTAIEIVNQVAEEYVPDINVGSNDGWIPCSERLPEKDGCYLCQCRGFFRICGFAKNLKKVDKYDFANEKRAGFYEFDHEYGYYEALGVIAWRELPQPYKGE